jgi:hypothetical protein
MSLHRLARLLATLLSLGAGSVAATDGVIEINQASAVAGGITPGDGAGFPVSLSQPGQYRLTSNLDVPGDSGIQVGVNDVTVDLNGFAIRCSSSCLNGVNVTNLAFQNTVVRNGTIRGFNFGVILGNYALVERIAAIGNSNTGVSVNIASVVRDCIVTANGTGITANGGSMIAGNLVDDNVVGLCTGGLISHYRDNILLSTQASICGNSPVFNAGGNQCQQGACPP